MKDHAKGRWACLLALVCPGDTVITARGNTVTVDSMDHHGVYWKTEKGADVFDFWSQIDQVVFRKPKHGDDVAPAEPNLAAVDASIAKMRKWLYHSAEAIRDATLQLDEILDAVGIPKDEE